MKLAWGFVYLKEKESTGILEPLGLHWNVIGVFSLQWPTEKIERERKRDITGEEGEGRGLLLAATVRRGGDYGGSGGGNGMSS